jgi:hypothetical protein
VAAETPVFGRAHLLKLHALMNTGTIPLDLKGRNGLGLRIGRRYVDTFGEVLAL